MFHSFFDGQIVLQCRDRLHSGCFQFLAALHIYAQVFVQIHIFISLLKVPGKRWLGHVVKGVVRFITNCQSVRSSVYGTVLHSHQKCLSDRFSTFSPALAMASLLSSRCSDGGIEVSRSFNVHFLVLMLNHCGQVAGSAWDRGRGRDSSP